MAPFAMLLIAAGAPPQAAPAEDLDIAAEDITVVGTKLTPAEARRQAVDFVRLTGAAVGERPVARWTTPVCPRVLGVTKAHARLVEAKIRDVAARAGVRAAPNPCRANILVSFVGDGNRFVQRLASRQPERLREIPLPDRERFLGNAAPVRWWYSTEYRGKHGVAANTIAPISVGTLNGVSVLPTGSDTQFIQQYNSSIISTQTIRALTSAAVVIDVNRSSGVSLDAVATYAAMVSLAEIQANRPPTRSILSLFTPNGYQVLSEWDLTFLRELYKLPPDRKGQVQRRHLVRALLEGPPDSGRP